MKHFAGVISAAVSEGDAPAGEKAAEDEGTDAGGEGGGEGAGEADEGGGIPIRFWWDCFAAIRRTFGLTPPEIEVLPCIYFINMVKYISIVNREEIQNYQHELARMRK